jgi:hypothetical protein
MSIEWMAGIAGTLIGLAIVTLAIVLIMPAKQHDPQRGMAVGCLMIVIIFLLIPGGLLLIGVMGPYPQLVRWIFWPTVIITGWALFSVVMNKYLKWSRERRWARESAAAAAQEPPSPTDQV